jgi:lipid-A-disaccharide synthase
MKRVEKLKRACDHVLCIFPFEPELLAQHGVAATYVGHPLANVIPMEPDQAAARRALGLPAEGEVIALLPGSRASEIEAMTGRFLAAAALLQKQRPKAWFVLPAMPALQARISQIARSGPSPRHLTIVTGQSHPVLAACDVALVASGTATLETALFKRPMVIAYHTHWLTYALMKPRHLQPWVGLPNILCRDFVVPELLQSNAKPELLSGALADWLQSPDRMRSVQQTFRLLHATLQRDTATLATDAVEKVLAH